MELCDLVSGLIQLLVGSFILFGRARIAGWWKDAPLLPLDQEPGRQAGWGAGAVGSLWMLAGLGFVAFSLSA